MRQTKRKHFERKKGRDKVGEKEGERKRRRQKSFDPRRF